MRTTYLIFCLFSSSFAWLLPERCEQQKTTQVPGTAIKNVGIVSSIEDIAAQQHALLKETYKNHKFRGVPTAAACENNDFEKFYLHVPYNCAFKTYAPRLLSSVACNISACKLTHTVSTVDTYTASEGYSWGVKITSKASILETFEVGGEVTTGGTYSCTYSKGRTTTDTVECSDSSDKGGLLQLYNVKSDMECDFGNILMQRDKRDGSYNATLDPKYFSFLELIEILISSTAQVDRNCISGAYVLDTSKISDRLFQKIMKRIPHYNPYTDLFKVYEVNSVSVLYYKENKSSQEYSKTIPFTNESGDSVFQYACLLNPF